MQRLITCQLRRFLRDYRLLLALVGGVLLMVAAGITFRLDQTQNLRAFAVQSRQAAKARSLQRFAIPRPAAPLALMSAAAGSRRGEVAVVKPHLVDRPEPRVADRSFVFGGQPLEWSWIVLYFFSLMTLGLSYDAVTGEKEQGTLKAVMSSSVSRLHFVTSKFVAVLIAVMACLFVSTVASLLVATAGSEVSWSSDHWLRIGLFFLVSAVFLAFNALLGIAASVLAKKPASSLQIAVGWWIALVFLVPGTLVIVSSYFHPIESESEFRRNILLISQNYQERLRVSSPPLQRIVATPGLSVAEKRLRIAEFEATQRADQERALEQRERDYANLRRDFLARVMARQSWIERWSTVSPHALFRRGTARLAGSGLSGERNFLDQVGRFEPTYTAFVEQQREIHRGEASEGAGRVTVEDDNGVEYTMRGLLSLSFAKVEVAPGLFPTFVYRPPSVKSLAPGFLLDLGWLLLFCLLLSLVVGWRFLGYDLR